MSNKGPLTPSHRTGVTYGKQANRTCTNSKQKKVGKEKRPAPPPPSEDPTPQSQHPNPNNNGESQHSVPIEAINSGSPPPSSNRQNKGSKTTKTNSVDGGEKATSDQGG